MTTYYEVLGVPKGAAAAEIKSAYRRLSRKYHPDVSEEPDAEERFKEIAKAYEILFDSEKRARYDETGTDQVPPLVSQARQIICGLVLNWINQFGESLSAYHNLPKYVMDTIAQQERAAVANVAEGEKLIAKTERAISRLRFKGTGHDYVSAALNGQLEQINGKIALARENVERIRLAMEYARDYDFENPFSAPTNPLYLNQSIWQR